MSGASMIAAPTLFGLLSKEAKAQAVSCGLVAGSGRIPFICFDLAGGSAMAGSNVLGGGTGGQLDFLNDSGYLKMGMLANQTPRNAGNVADELGLLFHSDSGFFLGIQDKTSLDTRLAVNGSLLSARSDNDTGNNPHNPIYGINKAGADGDLVTLVGTQSSDSGGNSLVPMAMFDPTVRPTKVERPSEVTGLVDTGKLIELLDQQDAGAVMSAVERLSDAKVEKITEADVVKELIRCSYIESTDLVATFGDPNALDPLLDDFIFGQVDSIFDNNDMNRSEFRKTASIMKLVQSGLAGGGTVQFGGYDYHDGTRATGDAKDFLAGQAIGACLEYASRRGEQLMIYVFSDGSVASDGETDGGKPVWRGDNSSTAASFILVYDPPATPGVEDRPVLFAPDRHQIGWYRGDGSVETGANAIANNVTSLAESVVLNYLALHDEVGRLDEVLDYEHSLRGLSPAQRDALVGFAPIRSST